MLAVAAAPHKPQRKIDLISSVILFTKLFFLNHFNVKWLFLDTPHPLLFVLTAIQARIVICRRYLLTYPILDLDEDVLAAGSKRHARVSYVNLMDG